MPPRGKKPPRRRREAVGGRRVKKKVCHFCKEKISYVDYKDVALMRKFVSDRAKIRAQRVSGLCGRHQREVANAVKNSREMALLPYVAISEGRPDRGGRGDRGRR
jgi:small subunit ribosomal protein S18